MFLRRNGEEKDDACVPDAPPPRYRMIERIASVADDFFIQDDSGQRAFLILGKSHRLDETLILRDLEGNVLCGIQQRTDRTRDSMEIEGPDRRLLATIRRTMITPLRDRYEVKVGDADEYEVTGNIVAHDYRIGGIAKVSTRWFRTRESYGVEVAPGHSVPLILAVTICIDQMTSELT